MAFPKTCPAEAGKANPQPCRTTTATHRLSGVVLKDDDGKEYRVNRTIESTTCLVCGYSESETTDKPHEA